MRFWKWVFAWFVCVSLVVEIGYGEQARTERISGFAKLTSIQNCFSKYTKSVHVCSNFPGCFKATLRNTKENKRRAYHPPTRSISCLHALPSVQPSLLTQTRESQFADFGGL